MNVIQQGILTLIKSAVTEQKLQLPDGFDIADAAELISHHQIVTLAYDGAVRCGISQQQPQMQKLFHGYCRALQISERQMKELRRIYAAFEECGIDYMPLKGCNMKPLYPKPELRLMGDADLLIRMEQYEKIIPIMKELGFAEKNDTDHELTWESAGLYLELHKRVIPSYNKDFYEYFGDGWQLASRCHGTRYFMTAEDEFIYLFTHFAKHFRDGGIGCRHLADLWVYCRSNPGMNRAYIKTEIRKLQMEEFYENICRLMEVWFGAEQSDDKTDLIGAFIFASGSFGLAENRALSLVVRDAGHSALGFNGRLMYLWRTAFPGAAVLRNKYTVLKKQPYLLPLVWLVRPFYKVLFESEKLGQQKKNIEVLSQDNLETRKLMMKYVGLEYHF